VAATADVRIRLVDANGGTGVDEIARPSVRSGGVAFPDSDLSGQEQRLGSAPAGNEAPLHEQLIQSLA